MSNTGIGKVYGLIEYGFDFADNEGVMRVDYVLDNGTLRISHDGKTYLVTVTEIPVCTRCEKEIPGIPVTDEDDPLKRLYCGEEHRDADAEAWYEQHYR